MSSDDATKINPTPLTGQAAAAPLHKPETLFDPARHVAPVVAHELNNILTIVQGYADRLLLRHGGDPELMPQLKLISEASRRAAAVVRRATPPKASTVFRNSFPPAQASA
jgi:nitrogen-specific signal transduction histidine kinase